MAQRKFRVIKFINPKESARHGWELTQDIWVLLRRHKYQPKELDAEACLNAIRKALEEYAIDESEIKARS